MPVQIDFTLSFDDYLAAQRLHNTRSWGPRTWHVLNRTLIPALGVLFIVLGFLMIGPKVSWFAVCYVIGFGVFSACFPLYLRYRYKRSYLRSLTNGGNCSVAFDPEGIQSAGKNTRSEIGWKAITHFRENDQIFLLHLAPGRFLTIPKRVCSSVQVEELQALFASCITPQSHQNDPPPLRLRHPPPRPRPRRNPLSHFSLLASVFRCEKEPKV